jgi:protein-tyrosine-phosphatase
MTAEVPPRPNAGLPLRLRHALASFVPESARRFCRHCADLDAGARREFVRQSIRRLLQRESSADVSYAEGSQHIVFICHGNILRSPFAAALLELRLRGSNPEIVIQSAGLHARPGRPADTRGVAAAKLLGVDLQSHRAAPLTAELVRAADLLVVMDFLNQAECIARFPEAKGKLRLLGAFDATRPSGSVEIPDPYSLDAEAVARCYEHVARCISGLQSALQPEVLPTAAGAECS